VNNARFIIQVSRGLIREARVRRVVMFWSILVAMVMLFAGGVFEWPVASEHPFLFIAYWGLCGWITLLSLLLALYDVVKVRADAQRAQRELAAKTFEDSPDDENPR